MLPIFSVNQFGVSALSVFSVATGVVTAEGGTNRPKVVRVAHRKLALVRPKINPRRTPMTRRCQYRARYGPPNLNTSLILFIRCAEISARECNRKARKPFGERTE